MFTSLVPSRGLPSAQHRMPVRAAEPMTAPRQEAPSPATHKAVGIGNYGMSTASQQKLNIRKFYGSELYKGLGSGFFDWGRTFVRVMSLAQASCDYLCAKDVTVDLFGHFLASTSKQNYH